jgi:large subunit ribosomal protein L28
MAGNRVSHSMHHSKRRFKPNIQKATLLVNGQPVQLHLCTRCLRTHHKTAAAAK